MHQPTVRVLNILEFVAKDGTGKRLSDFSRELGIPKSTLPPILQTLCQYRYLTQNDAGVYEAGAELFSLAVSLSGKFPVMDFVHSQLQSLVERFGETCYFGVLDGGSVLYLDKVDSTHPLRMLISTGRRLPAYATGIGKALLMDKSEGALRLLYPDDLTALTKNTVASIPLLSEQLKKAAENGYAQEIEESTEYIRCFAVPVRKEGKIVAAISVAVPVFRYEEEQRQPMVDALQGAALQIGKIMEDTDAHFGNIF